MNKKISVIITLVLIILGIIVYVFWSKGWFNQESRKLLSTIKDQPAMVELYNKAMINEKKNLEDPENQAIYFELGLEWKSVAEQMEGSEEDRKVFFQKSLDVYERGIVKFGDNNILFDMNGGNLAQRLGDFEKAERYYKKAIEVASGTEDGYIALTDLYYYKMKKEKEDILAVLNQGINKMIQPLPLISARATYLRRIGDNKAALEDYKVLSQNYPDHTGYKQIIAELEAKVSAN